MAFVQGVVFCMLLMPTLLHALTQHEIKELWATRRLSCMLVLGDSSVDPGNNNRLATTFKSNFEPYGMDFIGGRPTGRFSDGRLASDFIAQTMGFANVIPAFLDPKIAKRDLRRAVSFASAGSGYDDLTANLTNTISLEKQVNYVEHYKLHLVKNWGHKVADEVVRKAIFVISMGTNDYIQNYFLEPIRPKQFTLDKYQDFLVSRMSRAIQGIRKSGAERMVVVGVPPLGCMPLVMTIAGDGVNCVDKLNKAVISLNSKIQKELISLRNALNMNTSYVDTYGIMESAIKNPTKKYGFTETSKGCCGTGTIEFGDSCKGSSTCKDPKKYAFWDAVHPSERMYSIVADHAVESLQMKDLF